MPIEFLPSLALCMFVFHYIWCSSQIFRWEKYRNDRRPSECFPGCIGITATGRHRHLAETLTTLSWGPDSPPPSEEQGPTLWLVPRPDSKDWLAENLPVPLHTASLPETTLTHACEQIWEQKKMKTFNPLVSLVMLIGETQLNVYKCSVVLSSDRHGSHTQSTVV